MVRHGKRNIEKVPIVAGIWKVGENKESQLKIR
jgi:hypothetical protein